MFDNTNGNCFTTYAIATPEGSGKIGINDAGAHLAKPSDLMIIVAYAQMSMEEGEAHQPKILHVDSKNKASA